MKRISKLTRPEDGSLRAALFLEKPDRKIYPDYYILVPRPTSFKDITTKLKKGLYTSIEDVETEFALMAHNARMYNLDTSPVFAECESLREEFHLKTAKIREQFDLPPPPPFVVDVNSVVPVPEVLDEFGVQIAIFTPPGVRPPLPERTRGYIIYNTNGHKSANSSSSSNLNNNLNTMTNGGNGINDLGRSQSFSNKNNDNNNNNNYNNNNGDRDRGREINSLSTSNRSNPNQLRNVCSTSNLLQHSSSSSSSSSEMLPSLPSSLSSNNLSSLNNIQTTPLDQAIKKKPGSKNKRNSSSERNDSLDVYSPERKKIKKDADSSNSKVNGAPNGKEEKLYLSLFIPKKKSDNNSHSADISSEGARSDRSQAQNRNQNQNQYSDPKIPGVGADSVKAGSRGSKVKLKGMGRWPV